MTNPGSSWLTPAVGIGLGVLIGLAELSQGTPPILAASAIVIVGGYAIGIRLLRSRSETASLLLGLPVDERIDFERR